GNVSGDGSPPANEMTSGRSVTFRISRIAELVSFCARWDRVHDIRGSLQCEWKQCSRLVVRAQGQKGCGRAGTGLVNGGMHARYPPCRSEFIPTPPVGLKPTDKASAITDSSVTAGWHNYPSTDSDTPSCPHPRAFAR